MARWSVLDVQIMWTSHSIMCSTHFFKQLVAVWDPRTNRKLTTLRGHTDVIKSLILSQDGTKLLSGSSGAAVEMVEVDKHHVDSTFRLWDLGQQRCMASYDVHEHSVWSLAATPNFETVYSGGL